MRKIKISWKEYCNSIEILAFRIYDSEYKFNQIICLATGGFVVGTILSKLFDVPLAILPIGSYKKGKDGTNDQKNRVIIYSDLAKCSPSLGDKILLVDDLTESGDSLKEAKKWLKKRYNKKFFKVIKEIKTAVIYHKTKASSIIIPDFKASIIFPDSNGTWPWLIQPLEVYEIDEVKKRIFSNDI